MQHLAADVIYSKPNQDKPDSADEYTKNSWDPVECPKKLFKVTVPPITCFESFTKLGLVSDVAKTFDALGWVLPSTHATAIGAQD